MDEGADEISPISIRNKPLTEKLELIDRLDESDQQTIINVIDSMLTKKKMLDVLKPNRKS